VDVSVGGTVVDVSVEDTLVEVRLAATVGGAVKVGSWLLDGLHEAIVTNNRMRRDPDLIFISPLYPAHHSKKEEEMCGVVPNKKPAIWQATGWGTNLRQVESKSA
jgi:hypothetical protein